MILSMRSFARQPACASHLLVTNKSFSPRRDCLAFEISNCHGQGQDRGQYQGRNQGFQVSVRGRVRFGDTSMLQDTVRAMPGEKGRGRAGLRSMLESSSEAALRHLQPKVAKHHGGHVIGKSSANGRSGSSPLRCSLCRSACTRDHLQRELG